MLNLTPDWWTNQIMGWAIDYLFFILPKMISKMFVPKLSSSGMEWNGMTPVMDQLSDVTSLCAL